MQNIGWSFRFKKNYIIIPAIIVAVSMLGSYFTNMGIEWYDTLVLHPYNPSGGFIGIVWTIIFVLSAISALIFWNKAIRDKAFGIIVGLYLDNAILNVLWSWLFFSQKWVGWAIFEMILLFVITVVLICVLWKRSLWSAILLIPYVLWLIVATFLASWVYVLN